MTTREVLAYEAAVVESAVSWARNNGGSIDSINDLAIICEHFKVNMPKSLAYFISSNDRNQLVASGYHKNIYRFLDKLASVILEKQEVTTDD